MNDIKIAAAFLSLISMYPTQVLMDILSDIAEELEIRSRNTLKDTSTK